MKLVAVSAGLRQPSSTRMLTDRLAKATRGHLAEAGSDADVQVVELRDLATAISHHLVNGFAPRDLGDVLEAVAGADGLIAVTPVFSASYSGLFKSFIDLVEEDALVGKPVLIAATGGSARHSLVLEHAMRPLFSHLRAVIAPTAVYGATEDWGATDDRHGDGLTARIDRAAGELAGLLGHVPAGPGPAVVPFEQRLAALRPA
ncbi:FMN reductase [Glycomyces tarimensis]